MPEVLLNCESEKQLKFQSISIKLFKSFEHYIISMQSYGFVGLVTYLIPYEKKLETCGVPAPMSRDGLDAILFVLVTNVTGRSDCVRLGVTAVT